MDKLLKNRLDAIIELALAIKEDVLEADKLARMESAELKFTDKEILSMPKPLQKSFRCNRVTAHVAKRSNGSVTVRCQIDGVRITATARTVAEAKQKFIDRLKSVMPARRVAVSRTNFEAYARRWLDSVKRPYVKPTTFKEYARQFDRDIFPRFGGMQLESIKHFELQEFINEFTLTGRFKTASKVTQLLTSLFDYAVADGVIERSPMAKIRRVKYEKTHGTALTREEERQLIEALKNAPTLYNQAFAFLCYTGLRRSELATVKLGDGFITVVSAKQRLGAQEKTRNVPLCPMLQRLMPGIELESIKQLSPAMLTRHFKALLPNHHLHDLRHTFITRAQECGIARELVSLWAGHAADTSQTSTVYTHLGQNLSLQLTAIKKFDYTL